MKILTEVGGDDCIIKTHRKFTGKDSDGFDCADNSDVSKKYAYKHEISELYFYRTIHNDNGNPIEIEKVHLSSYDLTRIFEEITKINEMPEFIESGEFDLPF